jgi:hypothetical protein
MMAVGRHVVTTSRQFAVEQIASILKHPEPEVPTNELYRMFGIAEQTLVNLS